MAFKMNKSKFTFGEGTGSHAKMLADKAGEMYEGDSMANDPLKMTDSSPMKVAPAIGLIGAGLATAGRFALAQGAKHLVKRKAKKELAKQVAKKVTKKVTKTVGRGPKPTGTGSPLTPKTGAQKVGKFLKDTALAKNTLGKVLLGGSILSSLTGSGKDKKTGGKAPTGVAKPPKVVTNIAKPTKSTVAKGGTKTWEQGMKSSGGNLNKLVSQRKGLKKGSSEYNAVQNKINAALGSKKRHGVQTTTKTAGPKVNKDTKRTTKTKVATPGLGSKQTKVVKGTKSNIRKTKVVERDVSGDVTKKTKKKYDVGGKRTKMKVTTKTDDMVTKLKVKNRKDEPAKVKTRKRRLKWL